MNSGGYISRTGVAAGALWVLTAGLLGAAWLVILIDGKDWRAAGMLAATAATLSPVSAVLHLRTYHCRVSNLIRATSGLGAPPQEGVGLRPMR